MANRQTKVTLSAEVAEYVRGMEAAGKKTREMGSEAEKASQKLKDQREAFDALGRGMMLGGGALAAATLLSVKAAADWESAWAGVTKTVDGTPDELAAVEDGLRGLTSVLPASHDQIAAVAEAAGQLGVQTDSVVEFTETMINLGETTNLSADEAATALARFSNIMGTSQDDVDKLGSAIVGLGNSYATTEAEIVAMSMRLAGAGKQVGLTEGDVLGLSTALSSVGIEAEAGGSAFSKVMIDIAASVDAGGDRLEKFASTAGLSADQFAAKWRTSPAEAMSLFVQGLSNAESQGTSTLGVLQELGITEVRMRDALLRSAGASDIFTEAMAKGNDEFEANNALTAEAAKRYATTESQLAIMRNSLEDAAIGVGEVFLPAVKAAAGSLAGFAQMMGDLPEPVQGLIGIFGGVAGAIGLAGGAALLAAPRIAQLRTAIQSMNGAWARTAFVGGGVTLAITAVIAAVGSLLAAHAQARQFAEGYADALKQGKDAADELAVQNLTLEKTFLGLNFGTAADNAEKLGIELGLVAEAAQGNTAAMDELSEVLDVATGGGDAAADMAERLGIGLFDLNQSAATLRGQVQEQSDALARGEEILRQTKDATDENTDSTYKAADAYLEAADETSGLNDELNKLIDTMNEANGVGQDAVSSNLRYEETLAAVAEQVEAGEKGLDLATEAGRNNLSMLNDLAADSQAAAEAQFNLTGDTEAYSAALETGRQKLIDSAKAMGASSDEAENLADKIYAIPEEHEIKILSDTANAEAALGRITAALNYVQNTRPVVQVGGGAGVLGGKDGFSTGGAVYGPGTGTSDSIPAMLSAGEHVWTAAEVKAAGGHDGVESLRKWVKSGYGAPVAQPAAAFPDTITLVDANGSILTHARVIAGDVASSVVGQHDRAVARGTRGRVTTL